MAHLSGADLTILEKRPHTAKVAVDFVTPTVVLEGDLPGSYSEHNVVQVPYVNGVGSHAAVLDGMPVYVYSSTSALKGVVRAKSADASYIYIAENDEVTFVTGDSFQIMKIFLIWPKYHIADVSGSSPIFYKDYDIAYTDQNQYPPPVPILGPHVRCRYLEGAASVDIDWDASSSYSIDSGVTITGYSWVFEGGAPGTAAVAAPTITYNTAGQYLTTLTITDSNGKTSVAYRWIIIRDVVADSQAVKHDIGLRGDFSRGGWEAAIATRGGPTLDVLPDGSPIAVTVTALAGGTAMDFADEPDLYFCGWLQKDTVEVDPGAYEVRFSAGTADRIMATIFSFDTFVYDVDTTPTTWLQIQNLTVREAGYHLLRWHSNILELIDVHLPTDATRTAGIDAPEGNLFDQLKNMFQRVRQLVAGCNNQGALYVQKNVQHMIASEKTTYDYNHQMQKPHYKAGVSWARRHFARLAMLELQGVSWDGSDAAPFFARAPGIVPVHEGKIKEITGLAVADQADCNELCGMFLADANNYQTGITFSMAGNWLPALDVFPQAMVILPVGLTIRGWSVSSEWGVVRGIEFVIVDNGAPTTEWTIDVIAQERSARPFYYPVPEEVPHVVVPPYTPPYYPPLPPTVAPGGVGRVHIATKNAGVYVTDDITAVSPTWTAVNSGLTGAELNVVWMSRDPYTPQTRMYLIAGSVANSTVQRNDDLVTPGAWSTKLTAAQAKATWKPAGLDWSFLKMKPQITVAGRIYVVGHEDDAWASYWILRSDDHGNTWIGTQAYNPCGGSFKQIVGATNIVPSPHTWEHVWLFGTHQTSVWVGSAAWRSVEGNMWHPDSVTRYKSSGYPYHGGGSGHIPYADNADELRIYLTAWYSGWDNHTYRVDSGLWTAGTVLSNTCDTGRYKALTDITPGFGAPGANPAMFGSYTEDKDRIWFVNSGGICGLSNNAGASWTQKATVPWEPQCCSGFPTNNQYFFAGRKSGGSVHDTNPTLLYVSDDEGATWQNKSGDLYAKIIAFMGVGAGWGTGIVTIAPEY